MATRKQLCNACDGATPVLSDAEIRERFQELRRGWVLTDGHHLEKQYYFQTFKDALRFTNRIGRLADARGHHPEIHLSWGKVRVAFWTHKTNGLTIDDFVSAAETDKLLD